MKWQDLCSYDDFWTARLFILFGVQVMQFDTEHNYCTILGKSRIERILKDKIREKAKRILLIGSTTRQLRQRRELVAFQPRKQVFVKKISFLGFENSRLVELIQHGKLYIKMFCFSWLRIEKLEKFGGNHCCVMALKDFAVGEKLDIYGHLADLSRKESLQLSVDKKDFSVIYSARKQCYRLFLGPARFVNHACNPNTEFEVDGSKLGFRVIREIKAGDQVTVYYSKGYFGENNHDCLCDDCHIQVD